MPKALPASERMNSIISSFGVKVTDIAQATDETLDVSKKTLGFFQSWKKDQEKASNRQEQMMKEAEMEKRRKVKAGGEKVGGKKAEDDDNIGKLLGFLGAGVLIFGAALVSAITLWATGLDTYIRSFNLVRVFTDELSRLETWKTLGLKINLGFTKIGSFLGVGITRIIEGLKSSWELIMVPIQALKTNAMNFTSGILTKIINPFIDIFTSITKFGGTVGTKFASMKETFSFLGPIIDFVADAFKFMGRVLLRVSGFAPVLESIQSLFTRVSVIAAPIQEVGSSVGKVAETVAPIAKSLGPISKMLRVAFGPFTMALFTIFDFVNGFIAGFESGGILGGLKEGAAEVFRGLITKPLDLIKDIVSWIAGKLGFDGFAESLDSFSFTEIFNSILSAVGGWISGLISWITGEEESAGDTSKALEEKGWSITGILDSIFKVITNTLDIIKTNISAIIEPVQTLVNDIITFFSDGDNISSLITSLWSSISGVIDSVSSFISPIVESVKSTVAEIMTYLTTDEEETPNALGGLLDSLSSALSNITEIFNKIFNYIGDKLASATEFVSGAASKVGGLLKSAFGFGDSEEEQQKIKGAATGASASPAPTRQTAQAVETSSDRRDMALEENRRQGNAGQVAVGSGNTTTVNNSNGDTVVSKPEPRSEPANKESGGSWWNPFD